MSLGDYPIFGVSDSTESQSTSWNGMAGWWTVAPGFVVTTDANGQVWATNPDDGKVYAARYDLNGQLMYQDLLKTRLNGGS